MEEVIRLTSELIRFRTTASRPDQIQRCGAFIQGYLRQHNIPYQRFEDDHCQAIAVLPGPQRAPVLLMSHLDVVEGPDELFTPRITNGILHGRGSIDDKYAVALSLVLFRQALERQQRQGGKRADLPFGLLITSDEETGGYKGAQKVLPALDIDFGVALDGGSLNRVVVKEKGILRLKLICDGKAAHGARPWLGENAIENLFRDIQQIKTFFQEETAGHWHRTVNLGVVRGGKALNQVPDRAEAFFDVRYTENDDIGTLVDQIRQAVQGELVINEHEPLFVGGRSPHLDLLLEMVPELETTFEHGASDARFLAQNGIPGIVWGADGDLSQHSEAEHVHLDSIAMLYQRLDQWLQRLATPAPGRGKTL